MKKILIFLICLVLGISNVYAEQLDKDTVYYKGSVDKYINFVQLSSQYAVKWDNYWGLGNFNNAFLSESCKLSGGYNIANKGKKRDESSGENYDTYDAGNCYGMKLSNGTTIRLYPLISVRKDGSGYYMNTSYGENYEFISNQFSYVLQPHKFRKLKYNDDGTLYKDKNGNTKKEWERVMFCVDPNGLTPTSSSSEKTSQLVVDRFLYENDTYLAEDYAKATILSNSSLDQNKSFDNYTLNDWIEYNAISFALRAFTNGVLHDVLPLAYDYADSQRTLFMYINTLAKWKNEKIDDNTTFGELYTQTCTNVNNKKQYTDVKGTKQIECNIEKFVNNLIPNSESNTYYFPRLYEVCTKTSCYGGTESTGCSDPIEGGYCDKGNTRINDYLDFLYNKPTTFDGYFTTAKTKDKVDNWYSDSNSAVLTKARNYLIAGMKAYNEASTSTLTFPSVELANKGTNKKGDSTEVIVSVKFKNFSNNKSSFTIDSYKTPNATTELKGYKTTEDGNTINKLDKSQNIYSLAVNNNNVIYLVFKVTSNGVVDDNENGYAKLSIKYSYDDSKLYSGALIKVKNQGDSQGKYQRFVTFTSGVSDEFNVEVQTSVPICEPSNHLVDMCSDTSKIENGKVISTFTEGYDENGNLNIGKCVLGNQDVNGNSYEIPQYKENPYCSAYCKEDITIKTPYKLETYAGKTLKLNVEITGKQSCYTSKIDYEQYDKDIEKYKNDTSKTNEIKNNLKACQSLEISYELDPKIDYEYQEKVKPKGTMIPVESTVTPTSKYYYCTDNSYKSCVTANTTNKKPEYVHSVTEITRTYTTPREYFINHNSRGIIKTFDLDNLTKDIKERWYQVSGLPISIDTEEGLYAYSLTFSNIGTFYSENRKGRIFGGVDSLAAYNGDINSSNKDVKNQYNCFYGVNIKFTPTNEKLCTDNDGNQHYKNECKNGETTEACSDRLCPKSSTDEKLCTDNNGNQHYKNECKNGETTEACSDRLCPKSSTEDVKSCWPYTKEGGTQVEYYSCTNVNSLSEINLDPVNGNCKSFGSDEKTSAKNALKDIGDCDDGNCDRNHGCDPCQGGPIVCKSKTTTIIPNPDPKCPACIVTIDYRTISTTKVNPNENAIGYNWYVSEGDMGTKAYYTLTEIENSQSRKYNQSQSGNGNNPIDNDYSLKVRMTPAMASDIRKYNSEYANNGSYLNETLYCKDYVFNSKSKAACENEGYTWKDNKCVIIQIFCYSSFIDKLKEDYPDDVFDEKRSAAKDKVNENEFNNYTVEGITTQKSIIKTNDYWSIFPDYVLDDAGPSWK